MGPWKSLAVRAARRASLIACCGACAISPRSRLTARITRQVADAALLMLDVDSIGLDVMDRKLLLAVMEKFGGGPVGVDNLAAAISEERGTIEDVLEPYLIQQGYMKRTPRGRMATMIAYQHFGIALPKNGLSGELWDDGQ